MFWASFDPSTSRLGYVNAGHLPAIVLRPRDGKWESLRLREGGPVLGVVPNSSYLQGSIVLGPEDLLIVFSDGIAEAENASGEEFGEARIIAAAGRSGADSPAAVRHAILSDVGTFAGRPEDDQTLVVLRFSSAVETVGQSSVNVQTAEGSRPPRPAMTVTY
jgi:sigma-B regulation protein RsbU (phosphoserine phosphatase)